jgi:hypothetical protein
VGGVELGLDGSVATRCDTDRTRYNTTMGFKLGAVVGFGAGYYLGAKAGRERYVQMNRWIEKARQTDAYEAASNKARDLADEGVDKAKAMATGSASPARARQTDTGDGGPDTPLPSSGLGDN